MTAGLLVIPNAQPSRDRDGRATTAQLFFYDNETTTPKEVYTESDLLTAHPHPVESDSAGVFPLMWADNTEAYTVLWSTADGQTQSIDDVYATSSADVLILQGAQDALEDAEQIAEDIGDLDTALTTANTAATTATTGATTATTQAAAASASATLAAYWASQAEAIAGGDFQPLDATLTAFAALTIAANKLVYGTGTDAFATTDFTAAARALLDDADATTMLTTLGLTANGKSLVTAANYAAMKALLDLEIGTDVQAWDAQLDSLSGATANGVSLITAANYAAMVTLLGLVELSDVEIWTGSDTAKVLTARRRLTAQASVSVTYANPITLDGNAGESFHTTLTGNTVFANPTNFKAGQSGRLRITQDGTGNRTATWGTNWLFPGGDPTLSTAAAAIDVVAYYAHSSTSIEASIIKALA